MYDKPIGKTDAIVMQHDGDYTVCGNDDKCKHEGDKKMVKSLNAVPWNERQWGHWLARNAINTKRKLGLGLANEKKNDQKTTPWQEKLADELYKPVRRNFTKRRVIARYVDNIWCSDLVHMQKLSRWNRGYKYLLMVLDIFSKYGWIVPLKNKSRVAVTDAFSEIFKGDRKPKYLWIDRGKEFYNKNLQDLLKKV